jgi:hypothetical protein
MKKLGLLLTVLLLQTVAAQNTRATIDGLVVHDKTGKPIPEASLELTVVEGGKVISRTTKTKEDGRFSFTNLPPGSGYQLVMSGTGFWTTAYGQKHSRGPWTPLTLEPGQHLADLRIEAPAVSQLSGKILDSSGKPHIGASVVALKPIYVDGRRQLQRSASTVANTRGEYRFSNLAAGRYYLRVSPRNDGTLEQLFTNPAIYDRTGRTRVNNVREAEGYRTLYYPGVPLEAAKPIHLEESQVVDGLDVTVAKRGTSRVRGTVINSASGSKVSGAAVALIPVGSNPDSSFSRFSDAKEGTFDLRVVQPGKYMLNAGTTGTENALAGRVVVEVRAGESHNFDVRVAPGIAVTGRIVMANAPAPDFSILTVNLSSSAPEPLDGTVSRLANTLPSASAPVSADGTFAFKDVMPWDYLLSLSGLRGAYMKSARQGTTDILTTGLRTEGTSLGELEIVLATDGGRLDGRVQDENRNDVLNAKVVIVPEVRSRRDLYLAASSTATGRFQLSNIPPGRYKIFAWRNAPEGAWLDPDFLAPHEDRGRILDIQSEAAEFAELTLIAEP